MCVTAVAKATFSGVAIGTTKVVPSRFCVLDSCEGGEMSVTDEQLPLG